MSYTDTLEEEPPVQTDDSGVSTQSHNVSWIKRFLREPFFHFLVIGALLFVLGNYIKQQHNRERYEVKLGKDELYRLASLWEKQYGTVPSENELKSLAENYIREEVLYREGVEMGLDKNDEVIRRRIAQKLEFLQQDLVILKDPTDEELQAYFEQHKNNYSLPEKVSFTHIYFSGDNGGDENALKRAKDALVLLNAKKLTRAPELGDRFAYLYDYSELSETNVVHQFGESEFSKNIITLPKGTWSGPLQSGYGYHLVFITAKSAPTVSPLADVKEKVVADYLQEARELKNQQAFNNVLKKYTIVRDEVSNEIAK